MKRALRIMTSEDENENKLKNPIDLAKIKKKVKANEYETPEEFFVDIKWIQHNSSILHPSKFSQNVPDNFLGYEKFHWFDK